MLLIDTGVLVAAADSNDPHHDRSARIVLDDIGPLMTTGMVIAETAYLLDRELGPQAEAALYTSIVDGDLEVEPLVRSDWDRVRELVTTYSDLRIGGTDASLIAVAERLGITRLATLDETHFRVVRPHHCDALELIH